MSSDQKPTGMTPDLLLHTCCGPCLEWPARQLISEGRHLLVYFYNPNVQPAAENRRRLENMVQLAEQLGLPYVADQACDPDVWQNWNDPSESRCHMCYRRRLLATAGLARREGIPAFSTTLLVSPWQDHQAILDIGRSIARSFNLEFIEGYGQGEDFRDGYREGQRLAREDGLYRQKYCGCLPSLEQSDFRDQIRRDLEALGD